MLSRRKNEKNIRCIIALIFVILISCILVLLNYYNKLNNEKSDKANTNNEELITIIIPYGYMKYSGATDVNKNVNTLNNLGDDYVTLAVAEDNNIILKVTKEQQKNLIKQNEKFIDNIFKTFFESSSDYFYKEDLENNLIEFYYDEKANTIFVPQVIFGKINGIMYENILQNKDWNINVKIRNCHNNNIVAEFNAPKDYASWGPEEWKESYK